MKIKRFVADDLAEAVFAIRREWGADAVILGTQRLPRSGWRRLFRRYDRAEVTAAVESAGAAKAPAGMGRLQSPLPAEAGGVRGTQLPPPRASGVTAGGFAWARVAQAWGLPTPGDPIATLGRAPSAGAADGALPPALSDGPAGLGAGGPGPWLGPDAAGEPSAGAAGRGEPGRAAVATRTAPAGADRARARGPGTGGSEPVVSGWPAGAPRAWPPPLARAVDMGWAGADGVPQGRAAPQPSGAGAGTGSLAAGGLPRPRIDLRERGEPDTLRAALYGPPAPPAPATPVPVRPQTGSRAVVALVGPTGCGKTVTTAKLAAHLHMAQGWRVGLVSTDAVRVGAVEQLGAYARLLSLPYEVAPTPAALERALQRMEDRDVVLVDTAGCSHRDGSGVRDLAQRLAVAAHAAAGGVQGAARPVAGAGRLEVHLVVEATARRAEAEALVATYRSRLDPSGAGAARLLLTKLDACAAPTEVAAVAADAGLPLSYFTAGPRVPDDLDVAWPDRLAEALALCAQPVT